MINHNKSMTNNWLKVKYYMKYDDIIFYDYNMINERNFIKSN